MEITVEARTEPPPHHLERVNGSLSHGRLRLGLLGGVALRSPAGPAPLTPHLERLLAFLALQGRSVHRAYVAGRLWTDRSEECAHACLRTSLWRLRRLAAAPPRAATAAL